MHSQRHLFPLATAMRVSMRKYNLMIFKQDFIAGLVVSLIALPLSMALSIAVGLPPENGIYTAIIAGIAAALLGGSSTQVSGPTAAFVVIVAPIVAKYGLHGIIWCQIFAGIILIILGSARLGRYINYVPYPVTTGFTAGIGLVIATLALNDFFGLGIPKLQGDYIEKLTLLASNMANFNPYEFMVGLASLLVIIFFGKVTGKIPSQIVGIAFGTLVAWIMSKYGHDVATIGSRFSYEIAGVKFQGIPPYPPIFHLPTFNAGELFSFPDYNEFKILLVPSLVIAALGALESLLSATVADSMAGTKHNPNSELNGIGIANILSGLASGIPATGAIARTSVNIHSGAKTPIAAIIHALFILVYVLLFVPLINYIPMAALAALMIHTAYKMAHVKQFVHSVKTAPRSDAIVLLTCFILTTFIDMVAGVSVGIVLASLLFMQKISSLTQVELSHKGNSTHHLHLPDNVMVYKINGALFFGTVEKAFEDYNFVHDHVEKLIIDMENVPMIDMTGMVALSAMLKAIAREGRQIVLCGTNEITSSIISQLSASTSSCVKTSASLKEAIS